MNKTKIDLPFLISAMVLLVFGYLIFASASLGLLSKEPQKYSNVAFNQTVLGLLLGGVACYITSQINYKIYKKYALVLFIVSIITTLLVFVPGLGFEHGGAKRWIDLGPISFQPSEFLKIGFVIFLSAWIATTKERFKSFKFGFLPFSIMISIIASVLLFQPDTDTFMILFFAGLAMFLVGGGKWKYLFIMGVAGIVCVTALAFTRPYVMDRINTFIKPYENKQGSGWQIDQSLIALGSGGVTGRGFGQSIQKFNVLPEPIGDSIFAVAGEEFGFIGTTFIVILFVFFAIRGLKIATRIPDDFGRLMVVGIVIMITAQAFVNMGAMMGIIPLSGITLPFVSHGGTALFMTLAEVGIVFNISKTMRNIPIN